LLGVSTAWRSGKVKSGDELYGKMYELATGAIELEYRITDAICRQMKPLLKKGEIKVLSIHNYFPVPDILSAGSGDALLLSSPDEDERKRALKYTAITIEHANDLEVQAVVLHLGNTGIDSHKKEFFKFYDEKKIESEEYAKFLEKIRTERDRVKQKYFDSVLFCLDKLANIAERENVMLGIENRYYLHQIPDFEEMGIILKKFEGSNIRYWHDAGHAETWQNLGIKKHEEWLKEYGVHLLGIHLHDCEGCNDHNAPGKGKVDFKMIKKYLKPETIKIIEVKPEVTEESLREGIQFLKKLGIE